MAQWARHFQAQGSTWRVDRDGPSGDVRRHARRPNSKKFAHIDRPPHPPLPPLLGTPHRNTPLVIAGGRSRLAAAVAGVGRAMAPWGVVRQCICIQIVFVFVFGVRDRRNRCPGGGQHATSRSGALWHASGRVTRQGQGVGSVLLFLFLFCGNQDLLSEYWWSRGACSEIAGRKLLSLTTGLGQPR